MTSKGRAYAAQARADFAAYRDSGESPAAGIGEYHRVLFLRMALEKVAKAFLYDAAPDATFPHNVLARVRNRLRSPDVAAAAGFARRSAHYARLDAAMPVLRRIESAGPSVGSDGRAPTRAESELAENVEYPWQRAAGNDAGWVAPATHEFPVVRLLRLLRLLRLDPRARSAVNLLDRLIGCAERLVA